MLLYGIMHSYFKRLNTNIDGLIDTWDGLYYYELHCFLLIRLYADCIGRSLLHWLALVLWIDNIGTLIGTVERSGIVVVYNISYPLQTVTIESSCMYCMLPT